MQFRKLDWNLLVVFDQLLQGKSVSDTARSLRLSQPAISNCLARLRYHFEDELFVPVGRKLTPTPFAKSLTVPVRHAVEDIDRILIARSDFSAETAVRQFTMVCSDYVYSVFLNSVIRRLAGVAPGISLKVLLNSDVTFSMLREGHADFLIAPEDRIEPGHPKAELFRDELSCIAWSDNDRIGETLTLANYLELGHVSVTLGPDDRPHIEQQTLDARDIRRTIAAYAPTFGTVGETVVGTPYIATLHRRAAHLFAQRFPLRVLDAPFEILPFREFLQWHRNKDTDVGVIWLREFMLECAGALPQPDGGEAEPIT